MYAATYNSLLIKNIYCIPWNKLEDGYRNSWIDLSKHVKSISGLLIEDEGSDFDKAMKIVDRINTSGFVSGPLLPPPSEVRFCVSKKPFYQIAGANSIRELENVVNKMIGWGFIPIGGVSSLPLDGYFAFYQSMVKYE